jgi:hypothetical protein
MGMKTTHLSPAAAACAAVALAKFPVETHPTILSLNSLAFETATQPLQG